MQTFFETITTGLSITNEPKRIECGAPDFIVTRDNVPVGYIETKEISVGIHDKADKGQFDRYKNALGNLIITDYINFELFIDGELRMSATIGTVSGKGIGAKKERFPDFAALMDCFISYKGKRITNSEQLAKVLAAKARLLSDTIEKALEGQEHPEIKAQDGLSYHLSVFRLALLHDLSVHDFADMYAQTIAYGMFAARLNDKGTEAFTRLRAPHLVPQSNPFLKSFFDLLAGVNLDIRISWVVDALIDIFNYVSVEDVLKDFGHANQDPFIHFYETFLTEYDPQVRSNRGVYYTPAPAVKFIVEMVNLFLKDFFDLQDGLADSSDKVHVLEPALGTGTFLAAIIDHVYGHFVYMGQQGLWPSYCKDHLLPRLNGFEILMAPYTMAHFKLDMKLKETGVENTERLRIYLTNSLDPSSTVSPGLGLVWLAEEIREAGHIKTDVPVMVVMGNPPYNVSTQNKGDWIEKLVADYKQGLGETNIQPLSDDYIKFIRYGQHYIEKNSTGILAYICNNSFLDGLIHRRMRECLLTAFDQIVIFNLHGSTKKQEAAPDGSKDENIFDIQQGVCIAIFVKAGKKESGEGAAVFYKDLWGSRKEKFAFLSERPDLLTLGVRVLSPVSPHYFFVPKDFSGQDEYETGFSLVDLFPVFATGVKTQRDDASIAFTEDERAALKRDFLRLPPHELADKYGFVDVRDWTIEEAKKDLETHPIIADRLLYRPFDVRYMNYTGTTKGIMGYPRYKVMRRFLSGENIGLVFARQFGSGVHFLCLVTNTIIEQSSQPFAAYSVAPLYLYPEDGGLDKNELRRPNLKPEIVYKFELAATLRMSAEKREGSDTFCPLDLLDYIYAYLHSPAYREKYREFLKIDFPRVPYPEGAGQFFALAALGADLRKIHLLEGVLPSTELALFPETGGNSIDKVEYKDGKVWINGAQYFDAVPSEVWEFYIVGYQPAQKWLKDRKGRVLDYDQIQHYQKIINALHLTREIQAHIDEAAGL